MITKYIVWDLDGVMINGQRGVIKGVNHVLEMVGRPRMTPTHEQMLLTAPKVQVAFERICFVPAEVACIYADMYRDVYLHHYLLEANLQDGILDVLEELRRCGMQQAIATNKRHECADKLCGHFGFTQYCSPIIGSDGKMKTTKADLIKCCLRKMGCEDMQTAVMIGDLPGDKESADNVGMKFIGVNYGYGFRNVPEYANSPKEIPDCIERVNHDNAAFKQ